MNEKFVTEFLDKNWKYIYPRSIKNKDFLTSTMLNAPASLETEISQIKFKSPMIATLISACFGFLGIDRFIERDFLWGAIKLFTFGGLYILWILDAINAARKCRNKNYASLFRVLHFSTAKSVSFKKSPEKSQPENRASNENKTHIEPIELSGVEVFLSYSHKDKQRLLPLFDELKRSGLKVWFDEGIRAGSEWEEEIIEQLAKSSSFLFFVTESSLLSANCRDELYQARKRNKKFINILIDEVDLTKPEFEWFDFRYSRYQQIPAYCISTEETISKIHNGLGIKKEVIS